MEVSPAERSNIASALFCLAASIAVATVILVVPLLRLIAVASSLEQHIAEQRSEYERIMNRQ